MKGKFFAPCFLLLLCCLVAPATAAQAGDLQEGTDGLQEEFEFLEEEEVVFSAARHEQDIADSPSAITLITREQIENSPCGDLPCLLRGVAEVETRQVTVGWAVVGARALTAPFFGENTVVLVDGREFTLEVLRLTPWQALPVHLEDIERIEVIRGPDSALYGANADSLVVSITTRGMEENRGEIFLGGGDHERSDLHLRAGWQDGDWNLQVSGGRETMGGFKLRGHQEGEVERLYLRLEHRDDSSVSTLRAGVMASDLDCQTVFGPARMANTRLGDLSFGHRNDFLQTKLSLFLYDSEVLHDVLLVFRGIELGNFPETFSYLTTDLDGEAQLTWSPFAGNLLIAGANYRWITFASENNDPELAHQHRVGVFLHDEQRLLDRLRLTGGLRFDYNSLTPFSVSPRLAGVWRFAESQRLRLAFGKAFRKPSFLKSSGHLVGVQEAPGFEGLAELIRNGLGGRDLKNETVTALETGYLGRFWNGFLTIEANLFYNRYRGNLLLHAALATNSFGMPDLTGSVMEFRNSGPDIDSLGGSITLTLRVQERWRLEANYTVRDSRYVSDSPLDVAERFRAGQRVPYERAQLANIGFHAVLPTGLRIAFRLHAASDCKVSLAERGGLFDPKVPVASPLLFFANASASWRMKTGNGWLEAGVRVFDLFTSTYREVPTVTRLDGVEIGGEAFSRQVFLFVRGALPGEQG